MSLELTNHIMEALPQIEGYVYPNEGNVQPLWSVPIVVYPYITGLVAGAFIMASLVRVFNVKVLEPVYRLSLLTALAFLLCAPLPLLFHLGHPERSFQVMMTPHLSSPMAMFGFVYAWYLMAVLLLELWFDYRADFVAWSRTERGVRGVLYRLFTVGVLDVSPAARQLDARMGKIISIVGIPSAFLLHGYVGFSFGSIKANPWWGNVLMPIIFIFSAIVSGMALCVFIYMTLSWARRVQPDIHCLDAMKSFLFYALLADAALEGLDWLHRLYSADESIQILKSLAFGKLFNSLLIVQACLGTVLPLVLLGIIQLVRKEIPALIRQRIYFTTSLLILLGVLAMRWNVVIGGQLFSKSLRGFTAYKFDFAGQEGWLLSAGLILLPFVVLGVFVKLFLSEKVWPAREGAPPAAPAPAATSPA